MNTAEYKVYPYRWVVLLLYIVAAAVIQMLWATFFSITTVAWQFYGFADATSGEAAISLLSLIFMVGMIVISIPSLAAFEQFGFKKSVGFGMVLTGAGALVRGILGHSYPVVLACTVAFAVAQPFILNAVGMVAGKWFPVNERATANGMGVLANYLGMMVGLLVTPLLLEGGMDIQGMLLCYGIISAVAAVLFVALVKEAPPTPPCAPEQSQRSGFAEGMKILFRRRDFLLALLAFFFMLGIFNTFFTLIEPILRSLSGDRVDPTATGVIGVVILAAGIVGSLVIPVFSDKDKWQRRKPYILLCTVIGTVGFGLFMLLTGFGGMVLAAVVYGLFAIGGAPVLMTYSAEAAHPVSEGTSEGLLMFAGNVAGVIFLGGAGLFGGNYMGLMAVLTGISAFCVLLMAFMREKKGSTPIPEPSSPK